MLDPQGLRIRAALFAAVRLFFTAQGFLEVDTPLRQPVIIPESNIVPLTADGQYLQTSPELCMKRILAAGCPKIFQICPCFRKDERGRRHLEEFTMLEWYRRDADYHALMTDCEDLLQSVAERLAGILPDAAGREKRISVDLDLAAPWPRLTVEEAFRRYSPLSLEQAIAGDCFEEILVEFVEPRLGVGSPVFLLDYPAEMASLARRKADEPARAERFELYLNGIELANGFSELTDADEQRQRFRHELDLIERSGRRPAGMPERFLDDLDRLPSAAGIAFGLDRLFMLLMGRHEIGEVVSFAPEDF
jgi:elongation factor P--(R)-beta-lysine ligase